MAIDPGKIEEWTEWQGRLRARMRLTGWVGRTFDGEVDDLEQARGAILAAVDLAQIAYPALLAERQELLAALEAAKEELGDLKVE